jgi:hypothetical protein
MYGNYCDVDVLLGRTVTAVTGMTDGNDEVVFTMDNGDRYKMYHNQDCCESVYLESVVGDVEDLIGEPLLMSAAVDGESPADPDDYDVHQWTFYKFATRKGYVDLRWHGSSNGYYSTGVDFEKIK